MLFPKKVKHRKWQVGRKHPDKLLSPETRGVTVAFGSYGLKATTQSRVTSNQIEAARRVVSRTLGKTGKIWIRIFPDKPFTKKPAEVGMGKGKGDPAGFIFDVRPGRMLFEIDGVSEEVAREALRKAACKLPVKAKFVNRDETRV
jgi:large subunit ribosomal protein L16